MANKLTNILKKLGAIDDTKEGLGKQILSFLVEQKCTTLDLANEQFATAYQENGWSRTAGRPKDGSKEKPAPATVKNYVTAFRVAYGYGFDVLGFETVGAMRLAIREKRIAEKEEKEKPTSLVGVQITKEDILTGFLVHDISAVITHLPDSERLEFEAKLQRLLSQYAKKAPADLKLAA